MVAELFLRPSPRAFFLITDTHALVFRQPDAAQVKAARSVVVAEFLPLEDVDMRGLVRAGRGRTVDGVLGVTSVPSERSPVPDIFLLLLTSSTPLSPLLPRSSLRPARVVAVEFHSLTSSFWDPPDLAAAAFDEYDEHEAGPSYRTSGSNMSQAEQQRVENPCNGMRKYLESGGFFYAEGVKWDISARLGRTNWIKAEKGRAEHPLETWDERFVWNANLLAPLLTFRKGLSSAARQDLDEQALLIPVVQGYCGSKPISTSGWTPSGQPEIAALGLISRLSWKRAGARFRTRGIDDDGQVANFVETELILATEHTCLSFVQVRGSVPLFWQQPSQGIQTLQQKVEITRPPEASQHAFDKHFLDLLEQYHSVHAVNLLGQKDAESMLSLAYRDHMDRLSDSLAQQRDGEKDFGQVDLTQYDFHAAVKNSGNEVVKYDFAQRIQPVNEDLRDFGWTALDSSTGATIEQQRGVFRTNCLDCLDRTNYTQDVISSLALEQFLHSIESPLSASPTLWSAHRELWADNGDRLSKIYAGTGALNTSATRSGKKTFAGLLSDATKSVGRAYINNFQDKGKQQSIDMLLGMMAGQRPVILFDPIGDSVQSALAARMNEYSSTRKLSFFVGTWNLNGCRPGEALDSWLFPPNTPDADIYMLAFQEIVQLNAQQILQTDPTKRRMWETHIMETFAAHGTGKADYLLFRSEQLVGTALIVVVKSQLVGQIRSVETATKKTGLSGLSGNKGGVGVRFDLCDSTVCLMTCHLAAGHSNVSERNADYRTISTGLRFLRGKIIEDHDIVIWAADFNYRISLPNDEVRGYLDTAKLDPLIAHDQLQTAMDEGEVFHGYDEGPISFLPTYKYDNGTDEYDTSEKQRIPAWTDRVLWKSSLLRLKDYNRAELRTSDHRPVYAVFDATIREVNQGKKESIRREIEQKTRGKQGDGQKVDQKVEKALRHGGLDDLAGLMTSSTVSSPRSVTPVMRVPVASQAPKLPPRPPAATTVKADEKAAAPVAPLARPRGSVLDRWPPAAASQPPAASMVGVNSTSNVVKRKPAPAVPSRQDSAASASSTASGSAAVHPLLLRRAMATSAPPSAATSLKMGSPTVSPTLSPASTGDFMVVKPGRNGAGPPPLPSRQASAPSSQAAITSALDADDEPPLGLMNPVMPDVIKAGAPLPVRNGAAASREQPPLPSRKPSAATAATNGSSLSRSPLTIAKKPAELSVSPEGKKVPPIIPRKPAPLRSTSSTGSGL